ncbi:MAG: hypothetical protein IKL37_04010, partial [Alphaproteobacteria bacterium]|nr:hypothetical protein [Alphaproteobacteria bacterium]
SGYVAYNNKCYPAGEHACIASGGEWHNGKCACTTMSDGSTIEQNGICVCNTAAGYSGPDGSNCSKYADSCRSVSLGNCNNTDGCLAVGDSKSRAQKCVTESTYKQYCTQTGGIFNEEFVYCDCSRVDMNQDGIFDSAYLDIDTGACIAYSLDAWCTDSKANHDGTYFVDNNIGMCLFEPSNFGSDAFFDHSYAHLTWLIPSTEEAKSLCRAQGGNIYSIGMETYSKTDHFNFTTCTCSGKAVSHSIAQRDANGNCMCDATFVRSPDSPEKCVCPNGTWKRKDKRDHSLLKNKYENGWNSDTFDPYLGTKDLAIYWYLDDKKVLDKNNKPIDIECVITKSESGWASCAESCVSLETLERSCGAFGDGTFDESTGKCQCKGFGFESYSLSDDDDLPHCMCASYKGFVSDGKGGCKCDKNTEYNADVNACVPIGSVCDAELSETLSNDYVACKCDTDRGYTLSSRSVDEIGVEEWDWYGGGYLEYWPCQYACSGNPSRYVCRCEHGVSEYDEATGMYRCVQKPYDNNARLACALSGGEYVGTNFDNDYCTANMTNKTGCHYECWCASNHGQVSATDENGYEICTCNEATGHTEKEGWLTEDDREHLMTDTLGNRSSAWGSLQKCTACLDGEEWWSGAFMDITGVSFSTGTKCIDSVEGKYQSACETSGGTWNANGTNGKRCTCNQAGTVHARDVFSNGGDICLHWNAINCMHNESQIDTSIPQSWTVSYDGREYKYLCNASECDKVREYLQKEMGDAYKDVNPDTGWDYQKCKSGEQRCFPDSALENSDGQISVTDICLFGEIDLIQPSQ